MVFFNCVITLNHYISRGSQMIDSKDRVQPKRQRRGRYPSMTMEMRHELFRLRTTCSTWRLIAGEFNSRFEVNFGWANLLHHYRATIESCRKAMIQLKSQLPCESEWLAFRQYLTAEDKRALLAEYHLRGYEVIEEEELAESDFLGRHFDSNHPGRDHEATDIG